MNCRRFQRLLAQYLYDELEAGEVERLAGHAAACPECRRLKEELEKTVSRLSVSAGPVFSDREKDRLRLRVREAIRAAGPDPRPLPVRGGRMTLLRPLFLPAALAAAVVLLVLLRPPEEPPAVSPAASALAAFSEEVEEEYIFFAEVWEEIEEIERFFSPEPEDGAGIGGGEEPDLA